jgi:hypothetical protein
LQINPDDLRRHYASLSDEALLEIDPQTLSEVAQRCYDDELSQRSLSSEIQDLDTGPQPDWIGDAACACSFASYPGDTSVSQAETARQALVAAGILCHVAGQRIDESRYEPSLRYEYNIMVPGSFNLQAASVLDKEIFNPKIEADWKVHLEMLSDEDLRALTPETICAGLVDRANRLKRVYDEEIARRNL